MGSKYFLKKIQHTWMSLFIKLNKRQKVRRKKKNG